MIQSIKVNNSEMEYITFGKWKKVFVIIPWLSIKSILLNEESIISGFSKISSNFTIFLFDRIKDIPKNYSIQDMAEDTYNAMIQLWIKSCNIFGASQWWMIAQSIAINHPEFIEKMILASTTYKITQNALKIISQRIDLAKQNKKSELIQNFTTNVYCEETLKKYWDLITQSNSDVSDEELQKFIKLAYPTLTFDIENDLKKIKCETLVIGSNNDLIFWWESTKNLSEKLKCEYYIYDNFGHAIYDEAPDFRDRMLIFLRS